MVKILSFLVVSWCFSSNLVEAVKSTTQVSICDASDNGSQDFHKGHKRDKERNDDTETFESTFYIAYTGPEEKFDVNDVDAVAFLQNSIRDTYNSDIGCDTTTNLVLNSVILNDQSLTITRGNNRELATYGLRYSLLNSYIATGRCKNCGGSATLLKNDAARRALEKHFRRRDLQASAIASFNDNLVTTLTSQQDFKAFQVITGASITSDQPVDWGLNFTNVAPDFSWVQRIVTP